MYYQRVMESRDNATTTHAFNLAFDTIWTIGQALNYTEQMRLQILTVNGTLSQTNCSNCDGIYSADSADLFTGLLDKCENFTMTEDIQSCMVKELAEITNCRDLYGELVPLNEFNYSNAFMGCVIRYNFQRTDFLGISVSAA